MLLFIFFGFDNLTETDIELLLLVLLLDTGLLTLLVLTPNDIELCNFVLPPDIIGFIFSFSFFVSILFILLLNVLVLVLLFITEPDLFSRNFLSPTLILIF